MIAKPDGIDKKDFCPRNLRRGMPRQHPDHHTHQPLCDRRIAIRRERQHPLPIFCMQPNLRLTPPDQVVIRLIPILNYRQLLPQLDNIFILVHPVAKHPEVGNDLVLCFLNRHINKLAALNPAVTRASSPPSVSRRPAYPSPPAYYIPPAKPAPSPEYNTGP